MPDPRRDDKSLIQLMDFLKQPRSIEDIRERFKLSERSAYRWMDYLRDANQDIVSKKEEGVVVFRIIGEQVQ